jgi:hypothetical protein
LEKQARSSFLKKRTKKLLLRDAKVVARPLAKNDQSFFASFCSQKEDLPFLTHPAEILGG